MTLREGQIQVRDLILGPGTEYRVIDFNPFRLSVRADQSGSRAWGHGGWSGAEWAEPRAVPIRVLVRDELDLSTAGWLAAHQRLASAFRPIGDVLAQVEMRFVLGGREYLMRGTPRLSEPEMDLIGLGSAFTLCGIEAQDPLIYDGTESTTGALSLPTFTGGLSVPFSVPFSVDATQVGGFADLANEGTADTGLSIRVDGPLTEPSVTLTPSGGTAETLSLDLELASGEHVDIDTAARSVLSSTGDSLRGQASGEFFLLPPGTSRLDIRGGSGSGTVTTTWRSAWW